MRWRRGWKKVAPRPISWCLPEYACVELGAALAGGSVADEARELAAMVVAAPEILAAMRAAARRLGVWLLPGTLPVRRADGRIVNRAPLIAPGWTHGDAGQARDDAL